MLSTFRVRLTGCPLAPFPVFSLVAISGGSTGTGLPWLLLALEELLLLGLELGVDILHLCFTQPVNCTILLSACVLWGGGIT